MKISMGARNYSGLRNVLILAFVFTILFIPANTAYSQTNSPPEFSSTTYLLASSENPAPVRPVGVPVVATDPDPFDKLIYSLAGEDGIFFNVMETSGQLESRASLDYETRSSYLVELRATDSRGLYDTASVNISVTNVDEAGEVILRPMMTNIGAGALASLTDPDGSISNVSWQWAVSSDKTTWRHIEGADSPTYVPREEDLRQFFRVQATYNDGHGPGKVAATLFDATLLKADNHPPEFPFSESGTRTIRANAAAGELVGPPMLAGDLDRDLLTYWLTGKAAPFFEVELHTGQLRTRGSLDKQFEGRYFGEVHVFDGKGGSATKTLRIDVGDIPASVLAPTVEEVAVAEESTSTAKNETPNRAPQPANALLEDTRLPAPGGRQELANAAEPEPAVEQPTRRDPNLLLDPVSQESKKPVTRAEPTSEANEEPLAAAPFVNPPPLLSLVEGAPTGAVDPTGGRGQAESADDGSIGSLFKWIIGLSLGALLVVVGFLLLSKTKTRKTHKTKLPSPTIGPERRLGPLPFLFKQADGRIVSRSRASREAEPSL